MSVELGVQAVNVFELTIEQPQSASDVVIPERVISPEMWQTISEMTEKTAQSYEYYEFLRDIKIISPNKFNELNFPCPTEGEIETIKSYFKLYLVDRVWRFVDSPKNPTGTNWRELAACFYAFPDIRQKFPNKIIDEIENFPLWDFRADSIVLDIACINPAVLNSKFENSMHGLIGNVQAYRNFKRRTNSIDLRLAGLSNQIASLRILGREDFVTDQMNNWWKLFSEEWQIWQRISLDGDLRAFKNFIGFARNLAILSAKSVRVDPVKGLLVERPEADLPTTTPSIPFERSF